MQADQHPMPAMSSTAETTNRSLVPRDVVTAAAEAFKRRDQVPQARLLALRGVPPDQHQAGDADDLRPAVDLDAPSLARPPAAGRRPPPTPADRERHPRESCLALAQMLVAEPLAGITSQPMK